MVALLLGIIVSAATLAIVITSVHLTSNYDDRVDATQQGRDAMLKITQALNTSCVAAINFMANPTDNWTALGRASNFSDAVVLRLASASGATGAANLPCT
jgi:Tfp pilus assembly protein PilW